MDNERRWLRKADLQRRYGVEGSTIIRWANDPRNGFPQPVKLGTGTTAWAASEIEEYDREMIAKARRTA